MARAAADDIALQCWLILETIRQGRADSKRASHGVSDPVVRLSHGGRSWATRCGAAHQSVRKQRVPATRRRRHAWPASQYRRADRGGRAPLEEVAGRGAQSRKSY